MYGNVAPLTSPLLHPPNTIKRASNEDFRGWALILLLLLAAETVKPFLTRRLLRVSVGSFASEELGYNPLHMGMKLLRHSSLMVDNQNSRVT